MNEKERNGEKGKKRREMERKGKERREMDKKGEIKIITSHFSFSLHVFFFFNSINKLSTIFTTSKIDGGKIFQFGTVKNMLSNNG